MSLKTIMMRFSWMWGLSLSGKAKIEEEPRTKFFMNLITGPEQEGDTQNYRTVLDATLIYLWTANLSQTVNVDFGHEENVPDAGDADWEGIAHYLTYVFSDCVSTTMRAEWFRDDDGARTGFSGDFYELTWGFRLTPWPRHRVLKNMTLRPEIRWDFSPNDEVFSGRHNQLTAAIDVIQSF